MQTVADSPPAPSLVRAVGYEEGQARDGCRLRTGIDRVAVTACFRGHRPGQFARRYSPGGLAGTDSEPSAGHPGRDDPDRDGIATGGRGVVSLPAAFSERTPGKFGLAFHAQGDDPGPDHSHAPLHPGNHDGLGRGRAPRTLLSAPQPRGEPLAGALDRVA